jgi:hypothetical protein
MFLNQASSFEWTQKLRHYLTRLQGVMTIVRIVGIRGLLCQWLDAVEVHDPKVAKLLCKMIPARCPFEREIKLFDHILFHIPSLCQLNPLYEQVVGLRFKALSYLANKCGEDVTLYC